MNTGGDQLAPGKVARITGGFYLASIAEPTQQIDQGDVLAAGQPEEKRKA